MRDLSLMPDLELALIQSELDWHDAAANRARFEPLLEQARGADLVVLPEMFSTGFSMHSAELAEPDNGPTTAWLCERARRINAVITGSLIINILRIISRTHIIPNMIKLISPHRIVVTQAIHGHRLAGKRVTIAFVS